MWLQCPRRQACRLPARRCRSRWKANRRWKAIALASLIMMAAVLVPFTFAINRTTDLLVKRETLRMLEESNEISKRDSEALEQMDKSLQEMMKTMKDRLGQSDDK